MSGKLRLPPDKRMYGDDIVPETPPPQSPPPKRVKCQVKDSITRIKTLDFFRGHEDAQGLQQARGSRSQGAALPTQAWQMRGISRPRRKRGQEQHILQNQLAGISERPLRLRH